MVAGTLAAAAGVIVFHVLFGLGETMLQPTVPAIVNDLASDRDRGRFNAVSAGAFQIGRHHRADRRGVACSSRHLGGVFIAVIVAGLGGVAVLALALERQITPRGQRHPRRPLSARARPTAEPPAPWRRGLGPCRCAAVSRPPGP